MVTIVYGDRTLSLCSYLMLSASENISLMVPLVRGGIGSSMSGLLRREEYDKTVRKLCTT